MYPYQQMYQQPMQFQQTQPQSGGQNMQIQNGGYVTVRNEEQARNYPVAPGSSLTFFNETEPYCYKKTMSFSPLDHPVFERYKIVKEEIAEAAPAPEQMPDPEWRAEIDSIYDRIGQLEEELKVIKTKIRPTPRKKEDVKDDSE